MNPTPRRSAKQVSGLHGEDDALAFLQKQGLTLIDRNFLCKAGEIDLIMQHGESLVFVEVRKRASQLHGGAAASITFAKQKKLIRAAQYFLLRYRTPPACRIDVVAIDGSEINWIKNAISS